MPSREYPHVQAAFYDQPWAILPAKLVEIEAILRARVEGRTHAPPGGFVTAKEAEAAAGPRGAAVMGKVAVMPVFGVLTQRAGVFERVSGMSGTEQLGQTFSLLLSDKSIKTIVFNVDSPGGSVFGVKELADKIAAARGEKKLVAVANSMMASAAYWIGSAAHELVVTPGGMAGSIGVVSMHVDYSRALDAGGVKPSYVYAGKYKVEGNPVEPLSDEARAAWQDTVDAYYADFVKAVAKNRGVSESDVRNGYGQGRVLTAKAAKAAGLVDRIDTLEGVLARLGADGASAAIQARALDLDELE